MSKMFYPKLGGNAVKWQEHKTQKPELNPSSLPVRGFPCGSNGKQSACNVGDPGLIQVLGRFPWKREWLPIPAILAWRIPWTEEPGRLQSIGLQRVRHDLNVNYYKL